MTPDRIWRMSRVHLQGMGVVGCMLAWKLWRENINFTWSDIDSPINAWKASTGCIYPCGHPKEMRAYKVWAKWYKHPLWRRYGKEPILHDVLERAAYWFVTINPPHGGTYKIVKNVKALHCGELSSYHLNVQKFVRMTRRFFLEHRRRTAKKKENLVISHGYDRRVLTHYYWGWSATAELEVSSKVRSGGFGRVFRPCFYLRRGRVTPLVYAMPKPGTPYWYAGSYMMSVNEPKSYLVKPKVEKWKENIESLTDGLVKVKRVFRLREGWRPCARKTLGMAQVISDSDVVIAPPMAGDGVRLAPIYVENLFNKMIEMWN